MMKAEGEKKIILLYRVIEFVEVGGYVSINIHT